MCTITHIPLLTTHNKSPFELLYGQTPDYSSLRVFGCACFVSLPPHERTKLQPRAHLHCFLGYGVSQKGFRCYDPISHCLRISHHVEFWKHRPFTSLQQFLASFSSESPIFTDLFLPFYHKLKENSLTSAASLDNSSLVLSPTYDPPVLDPVAPPSFKFPFGPELRHFTQVSIHPPYLTNYHCSFALATLYKPHTYREAYINPLWQQVMNEN